MEKVGRPFGHKVSAMASSLAYVFANNHNTIINIIGVVSAFAAEWFVEENKIFSCPCTKELALNYGVSFIIGGFLIFWMIGLIIYTQTWRVCHGCFAPYKKENILSSCWHFLGTVCVKTMIFPLSWVFALCVDGDYIACMLSDACVEGSVDYERIKVKSQVWSFWVLGVLLALFIAGWSISRCFNKKNYYHYTFLKAYDKAEDGVLTQKITERANSLALEVVTKFLEGKGLKDEEWTEVTTMKDYLESHLSPLRKFSDDRNHAPVATKEQPANSIEIREQEDIDKPPAYPNEVRKDTLVEIHEPPAEPTFITEGHKQMDKQPLLKD